MTKPVLACAALIAVSMLAQAQEAGVQISVPRLEGKPFTTISRGYRQHAPNGHGISAFIFESGTSFPNTSSAGVHIGIEMARERQNASMNDIQEVRILDTQGRPMEFRRRNDSQEIGPTGGGSTPSKYSVAYELVNPSKILGVAKVTLLYQGKSYEFDLKVPPPKVKQ